MTQKNSKGPAFSGYEKFVIAILAILQFTIVLDFMVLSPLGAMLLEELHITPTQFSMVVSAYAFSAGASGLLAAGFADRFDRKKLLLFFYTGFIAGTVFCALAPDFHSLLIARIVTGIFGGVIGSISFAIITDLFRMEVRGRVMGVVQSAFAASQVMGIPIGLLLANRFGWHSPFWMIAGAGAVVGVVIVWYLRPITGHMHTSPETLPASSATSVSRSTTVPEAARDSVRIHPFRHLWNTLSRPDYLRGFLATTLLATGGFMLMPFGSTFGIHNLGLTQGQLPILYLVTGIFSMAFGPLLGKFSDQIGKYRMFCVGSAISMIMVLIYTQLGITPLWLVIMLNVILFVGISSRMISSSALMTAIPAPSDRGAFMSINSSVSQIAGGAAAVLAGKIVVQRPSGWLDHYDTLGYVVAGSIVITVVMMYMINKQVQKKMATQPKPPVSVLSEP